MIGADAWVLATAALVVVSVILTIQLQPRALSWYIRRKWRKLCAKYRPPLQAISKKMEQLAKVRRVNYEKQREGQTQLAELLEKIEKLEQDFQSLMTQENFAQAKIVGDEKAQKELKARSLQSIVSEINDKVDRQKEISNALGKEFLELSEKFMIECLAFLASQAEHLNAFLASTQDTLLVEITRVMHDLTSAQNEIKACKKNMDGLEFHKVKLVEQLNEETPVHRQIKDEKHMLRMALEEDIANLERRLAERKGQLAKVMGEIEAEDGAGAKDRELIKAEIKHFDVEMEKTKAAVEKHLEQVENLTKVHLRLLSNQQVIDTEKNSCQSILAEIEAEIRRLKRRIFRVKEQERLSALSQAVDQKNQIVENLRRQINQLAREITNLALENKKVGEETGRARSHLIEIESSLPQLQADKRIAADQGKPLEALRFKTQWEVLSSEREKWEQEIKAQKLKSMKFTLLADTTRKTQLDLQAQIKKAERARDEARLELHMADWVRMDALWKSDDVENREVLRADIDECETDIQCITERLLITKEDLEKSRKKEELEYQRAMEASIETEDSLSALLEKFQIPHAQNIFAHLGDVTTTTSTSGGVKTTTREVNISDAAADAAKLQSVLSKLPEDARTFIQQELKDSRSNASPVTGATFGLKAPEAGLNAGSKAVSFKL